MEEGFDAAENFDEVSGFVEASDSGEVLGFDEASDPEVVLGFEGESRRRTAAAGGGSLGLFSASISLISESRLLLNSTFARVSFP